MTSEEVRKKFLKFFEERGHTAVESSSLIPDDPSVLLTTAGVQQFVPYYTGDADSDKDFGSKNTVSIQKSFRTSDINEVGDETHLTFFEMMGNFSFGYKSGEPRSPKDGYFKEEAIKYAYDFITKELGLTISYVSVFEGSDAVPKDEESTKIWNSLGITDVREEGIEDVFWGPTGNSGPCGPTTEIYCRSVSGLDVEVWNIVFNQFFFPGSREELLSGVSGKELEPLGNPGVDTGMGFERLMIIINKKDTLFETDLLSPIIEKVEEIAPHLDEKAKRIFADHIRASTFIIADGLLPSNKEAGYILRRLLRRVIAYQVKEDVHPDLFAAVVPVVSEKFKKVYPEVKDIDMIVGVMEEEKKKFHTALAKGLKELSRYKTLTAGDAFGLYESYGLPLELIMEFASPDVIKGLKKEDFDAEFKKHQEVSRAGLEKKFGGHGLILDTGELKAGSEDELKKVTRLHTATHLMQAALREVLGDQVHQRGSDITAERTRFDFTFPRKVTREELDKVEESVNKAVKNDLPVEFVEMPLEEAKDSGALYVEGAKYPAVVKVYYAGRSLEKAFSKEICGGPHVISTGEVGKFTIGKEKAVSAGVRRVRADVG